MRTAVGGAPGAVDRVIFTTAGAVLCAFPVADFASVAVAAAFLAIAELVSQTGAAIVHHRRPPPELDLVHGIDPLDRVGRRRRRYLYQGG